MNFSFYVRLKLMNVFYWMVEYVFIFSAGQRRIYLWFFIQINMLLSCFKHFYICRFMEGLTSLLLYITLNLFICFVRHTMMVKQQTIKSIDISSLTDADTQYKTENGMSTL